jgi:hypothetical protein
LLYILRVVAEMSRVPPTIGDAMQTIEITDLVEARRSRRAQFRGEKATVMLNGLPVTGMVRSVMEVPSSKPTRWIVSVVPKQGIAA